MCFVPQDSFILKNNVFSKISNGEQTGMLTIQSKVAVILSVSVHLDTFLGCFGCDAAIDNVKADQLFCQHHTFAVLTHVQETDECQLILLISAGMHVLLCTQVQVV